MEKFNDVKNFIITFILGILFIAAGVANFAILLIAVGIFYVIISIVAMNRSVKSYRKSKAISKKDNQEKIEPETDEKDKQSSENDLHNEKSKEIPKETHYAEDSLLLLTYIKNKCNCTEPEALSEDEKEQFDKKLSNVVNKVFINRLASNSICIYNPSDGIRRYPYGNWIEVKKVLSLKM